MARPREFDEIEAMDSAVEVFRSKGYEAASLMDLLQAMKLSKSSLYNSFGTKHQLFLSALDHYAIKSEKKLHVITSDNLSARQKLENIFNEEIEALATDNKRGCFIHNSAIEVLPDDNLAAVKIENGLTRFKKIYIEIIEEGKIKGEISDKRDVEVLGDFLLSFMMGFRSFARAVPDKARLNLLVKTTLDSIF